MTYKAAMFDFDGTLTARGEDRPSQKMADAIVSLAQKMPIAFCTGRNLESFQENCLDVLLDEIDEKKRFPFLKNLFLMAENGSVGYDFDSHAEEFEEFYRGVWPDFLIEKKEFVRLLQESIGDLGLVSTDNFRVIVVIFLHYDQYNSVEKLYKDCDALHAKTVSLLRRINPKFTDFLHVGNAGVGVTICPADADKDLGIKRFGEFLNASRKIDFAQNYRDILVVGDRPQKGGNDYYFLNARFGMPFTVGDYEEGAEFPRLVFDEDGKRLENDNGTLWLVQSILSS